MQQENQNKLLNSLKEIHRADIAEIIQSLNTETREKFILAIKNDFDPEIFTYLNESLREEIIEKIDINKLATEFKELDIDDAVDVVEDLEESDKEIILNSLPVSERK